MNAPRSNRLPRTEVRAVAGARGEFCAFGRKNVQIGYPKSGACAIADRDLQVELALGAIQPKACDFDHWVRETHLLDTIPRQQRNRRRRGHGSQQASQVAQRHASRIAQVSERSESPSLELRT